MPRPIDMIAGFAPHYGYKQIEGGKWTVTVTPPAFTELPPTSIDLSEDQFQRFQQWREKGGMIQKVLADLSASQREVLMTGIGNEDFHRITTKEGPTNV